MEPKLERGTLIITPYPEGKRKGSAHPSAATIAAPVQAAHTLERLTQAVAELRFDLLAEKRKRLKLERRCAALERQIAQISSV